MLISIHFARGQASYMGFMIRSDTSDGASVQYKKMCDIVKDDILRVGGKAVVRLSRLCRAPQKCRTCDGGCS